MLITFSIENFSISNYTKFTTLKIKKSITYFISGKAKWNNNIFFFYLQVYCTKFVFIQEFNFSIHIKENL